MDTIVGWGLILYGVFSETRHTFLCIVAGIIILNVFDEDDEKKVVEKVKEVIKVEETVVDTVPATKPKYVPGFEEKKTWDW